MRGLPNGLGSWIFGGCWRTDVVASCGVSRVSSKYFAIRIKLELL
jgi:hypothetical protein